MTTTVYKQLATRQDLALGTGKVTQRRNGVDIELDKIDIPIIVDNITALRLTNGAYQDQVANLLGYTTKSDGGNGPSRRWDEGQAPGFYTDDGGAIITPGGIPGPAAWVGSWDGPVNSKEYGVIRDQDSSDAFTKMSVYSQSLGLSSELEPGNYIVTGDFSAYSYHSYGEVTTNNDTIKIDKLSGITEFVNEGLSDVSILASDTKTAFSDIQSTVEVEQTYNVADPNVVDAPTPGDAAPTPITTTADMLWRQRNNTTGVNSAQLPTVVGTFASGRKYDIIENTQYTISMNGAPLNYQIYPTPDHVQFFNADGTFHSNVTTGITRSADNRTVTFTSPAGAEKVAFAYRNFTDFSNTNPMTESSLQQCVDNIMLNTGATAAPFSEYTDGTYQPSVTLFDPVPEDVIKVSIQAPYFYIRAKAQLSPDKDVVWRLLAGQGFDRDATIGAAGVIDFFGIRFIDRNSKSTIESYNTSTEQQSGGFDESCPIRLNGMFVAGTHGVTSYIATMVAHGKTNVDVGSIWSDSVDEWVLYYIDTADTLTFVRRNTGTTDKWVISSDSFASTTLTHVSGATATANVVMTTSVQSQNRPILRDYLTELRVDQNTVSADGDYQGERVVMNEVYTLLNTGEQQLDLIAKVGAVTPDYVSDDIGEQMRFAYEFEWNGFGAMSVRTGSSVKDPFTRSIGNADYWGGIQMQRLALTGDSTGGMHDKVYVYIPEIAPVSGLDFEAIAEVTSNVLDIFVPATSCDDPADPASHFCLFGRAAAGVDNLSGHVFGYSRDVGLGIPAARAAATATVYRLSPAEKNYPWVIDGKSGDSVAAEYDRVTAFRAPFLPTDPDLSIPGVIVEMDGSTYCYITAHQNLTNKLVSVPKKYNRMFITVLKESPNVTINKQYIEDNTIDITVINSYGDVILKLGEV